MTSYKFKIADLFQKLLVIDVELPTFGALRRPSNPDSHWTTETAGLIAVEMGRCDSRSSDPVPPADSTGDEPPAPVSAETPIPELQLGSTNLFLCQMQAPYNYGIALVGFHSTFTDNESGQGWLYMPWQVDGGLKAGQITWVQV